MKKNLIYFAIIAFSVFAGCGKGIEPEPEKPQEEKPGFGGTITFSGAWPDSAKETYMVVFKDPLNSLGDFSVFNLRFVSREIPHGITSFQYSSIDSPLVPIMPGDYSYLAVAHSKIQPVNFDRINWFVSGIYYANGDSSQPGILAVPEYSFLNNININCDFNNLPPQPPGGN